MSRSPLSVASVLAAALAAPAAAQDLKFTNASGVTATFYGQINLTFQNVDDGTDSYSDFVDNSNSTSRLGLRIEGPAGEGRWMFNFETGLGLLNTSETNQVENPGWIDWQRTDIRKLEVSYTGTFGTVWAGQGSMATDNAAEVDNSGTSVAGYVNLADTAGSYQFRSDGTLSGITVGDAFKDFDGGRRFRIRYDTPSFSGVTVSAAYGQDILAEDDNADYYDVALRYKYDGEVIGFDSAIGYSWKALDGDTTEYLIASGTVMHKPSGANLTLAAGSNQTGDGDYVYVKLGWTGQLFGAGPSAVAVDYYDGSDIEMAGSSSRSWGIEAVQRFERVHLEAYLGYRVYAYNDPTADYQDLDALLVGARWRF